MSNKYYASFLSKLISALEGAPVSPAFWERVNLTQAVLLGHPKPASRSVAAPYFVTDLGVRKFADPAIFYREHLKEAAFEDPFTDEAISQILTNTTIELLADFIDVLILFTGSYSAVAQWVDVNIEKLISNAPYPCLINAGTVAAAMENPISLQLFERASELSTNINDKYGAEHRAAAFEIKRMHSPEKAMQRLNACANKLNEAEPSAKTQLDLALLANLKALADIDLDTGNESVSLSQAEEKLTLLNNEFRISDTDTYSRGVRYRSQIAINRAQIEVSSGNYAGACQILSRNVDDARNGAYDYLSEALGEYAYSLFLNGEYEKALETAREAFWHNYCIGGVSGIRMVREIGIASLVKMGSAEKAEELCSVSETDLIGSKGYGF
ncbi:hypothetical protein [Actinotignum schaalii]|uniref:MalT-like TPR region domain-containing protein n=1 Tax=Actinotignum schaalii FB123-CNA-2 TaxID=883067 RepID=S2VHL0_9ACTO|nr:hypothetical protein [Actinotignum schaalii]EPD26923.1 hypothetical protein HMPREF9237_00857 [Actinotignum schaalii FB123-CNA-2]